MPQLRGTRNIGAKNMQQPVAIPIGGMMIFLSDTGRRVSWTRHAITAAAPTSELNNDQKGRWDIAPRSYTGHVRAGRDR